MAHLQMTVLVEVPEGTDHKEVMDQLLSKLPDEGIFADVSWALDGTHLDEEGDPLW